MRQQQLLEFYSPLYVKEESLFPYLDLQAFCWQTRLLLSWLGRISFHHNVFRYSVDLLWIEIFILTVLYLYASWCLTI